MNITSTSPAGSTGVGSAADQATDAALAKATAKLTADRKAGAASTVLQADQKVVTNDTKAAAKADAASQAAPAAGTPASGINVTA